MKFEDRDENINSGTPDNDGSVTTIDKNAENMKQSNNENKDCGSESDVSENLQNNVTNETGKDSTDNLHSEKNSLLTVEERLEDIIKSFADIKLELLEYQDTVKSRLEKIESGSIGKNDRDSDGDNESEDSKKKRKKKPTNSVAAFKTDKNSFATGLNFYKLFWVFFIGCFMGVVVEVLFCLVTEQRLECRQGVIYGPFNPVYGFGAVFITVILYFLREKRDLWIFVGGSIIGGAFEWLCSYVQELFLGTVSWDYSHIPFNIGGRTCLLYSLFWGILAILWLKFVYPIMSKLIEKIQNNVGVILSWILVVFMIFNMLISSLAVYRMKQREVGVKADTTMSRFLDKYYTDDFLKRIYPNMRNPENGEKLIDKAEETHKNNTGN